MPIRAVCPGCQTKYDLAERLAGKVVRCRKCQDKFQVPRPPAEEEPLEVLPAEEPPAKATRIVNRRNPRDAAMPAPTPAPRNVRAERSVSRRLVAPRGSAATPVIGSVAAVVLVGVIIGGVFAFMAEDKPQPGPIALNDLMGQPPFGPFGPGGQPPAPIVQPPIVPDINPPQVPPFPDMKPPVIPEFRPPVIQPPDIKPPDIRPPRPPKPPKPKPEPLAWKVNPDPAKEFFALAVGKPVSIPLGTGRGLVTFPTAPSPFVALSQGMLNAETREVYDLRNGERIGGVKVPFTATEFALSPDGARCAVRQQVVGGAYEVFAVKDGSLVRRIEPGAGPTFMQPCEFIGADKLLIVRSMGLNVAFFVHDLTKDGQPRELVVADHGDGKVRAVSPGGRYLAVPHRDGRKITVFDLGTGQPAGAAELPGGGAAFGGCKGMAFSPDGKALAALMQTGFEFQLVTWNVASGKGTAFAFDADGQARFREAMGYQGQPLEWLPDGNGLFAEGRLLIDVGTGKIAWTLPRDGLDNNPRRVLPPLQLVHVKNAPRDKSLVAEALPEKEINAAFATVRAGRDPSATALPAAAPADWSSARALPAALGAIQWSVEADAVAPAQGLGAAAVPLSGKPADVQRICFAKPDAAKAVVLTAAQSGTSTRRQVRAERCDLAANRNLGAVDLFVFDPPRTAPTWELVADASPDGDRVVVVEPRDGRRVDVWSLADGKHVVGWLPFEKDADSKVRWVGMLDATHVVTLGTAGKLALWELPNCKAIWSAEGVRGPVALSAGRKLAALPRNGSYEIVDVAKGEVRGLLGPASYRSVEAAAFRPDGQELAAAVRTDGPGLSAIRWDLKTAKAQPPLGAAGAAGELSWCGANLMVGTTLLDPARGWPLRRFLVPGGGKVMLAGPDGQVWFVRDGLAAGAAGLAAQAALDEPTLALLREVKAGTVKAVVAPGMSVAVEATAPAPRKADELRQRIFDSLANNLKNAGLQAGPGGLKLTVLLGPERDTGEQVHLKSIGPRRKTYDVPVKEVACKATLTDAGGAVLWQQEHKVRTPGFFGVLHTDDPLTHLHDMVWNNAASWAAGLAPPPVVVQTPRGNETLPRAAILTGDR